MIDPADPASGVRRRPGARRSSPGGDGLAGLDERRRALLAASLAPLAPLASLASLVAWADPARGQSPAAEADARDTPPEPGRLALVIGNRQYPAGNDLPSIHKNARDLRRALQGRGFAVTMLLDADVQAARQAVDSFAQQAQAAPADATVLFYFSGHGAQIDAENLLVGAGVNVAPTAPLEPLIKGSLALRGDVLAKLPQRQTGLTMAVIDTCRTDVVAKPGGGSEGLNQAEAPPGCLIAFSTGAGTPAIAPNVETLSTFYTAALVHLLDTASDELSFSELFKLVKIEVRQTMTGHSIPQIRRFAQNPFIAENLHTNFSVAARRSVRSDPGAAAAARFRSEREAADWQQLQGLVWPPELFRLAEQFLLNHPQSKLAGGARVLREGASEAAAILQRNDVRLYRRSFDASQAPNPRYASDLRKAAGGDKDAAARIGRHWATPALSGPELSRFEGWMQYAAELGNGIASYELALHYRRVNQPQPAARWEARARALGYNPPVALEHSRK